MENKDVVREVSEIFGTFDGKGMIGEDGKKYPISPNYVSKSMLVEGDVLKLIITSIGTYQYKSIKPVRRFNVIGTYVGLNTVRIGDYEYSVLSQSVSYYHISVGDMVTCSVPAEKQGSFAAITGMIK